MWSSKTAWVASWWMCSTAPREVARSLMAAIVSLSKPPVSTVTVTTSKPSSLWR